MSPILAYDADADQEVYVDESVSAAGRSYAVEAATMAGSAEKPNEDTFTALADGDSFVAAVFDGATSLKPVDVFDGQSGARFASHFLKEQMEGGVQDESLAELMKQLNRNLRATYAPLGLDANDPSVSPAAVATFIKITGNTLEFAHTGDTFGIAYYQDGTSELFTKNQAEESTDEGITLIAEIAAEKNITPREARQDQRVKDSLVARRISRHNNPNGDGVGVLNGDSHFDRYPVSGTIDVGNVSSVLIASDGLLPPGWSLNDPSDRQRLLTALQAGGFKNMFALKRQIEDDDQDWNNIRYKHSDDATGVLIHVE